MVTRGSSEAQRPKTDILLVTATEVEAKTVLNVFPPCNRRFIGDKTYYDLGMIGGARTAMVQSEMGDGGEGGALLTVWEGIQALSPSTVIMVGIAFGLRPGKQQIGDILVSQRIRDYNPKKVGTDANNQPQILLRGDLVSAPVRPLDRFRAGAIDWSEPPHVYFGLIGKSPTKWTDLARKRGTLPSILDTGTRVPGQNRFPSGTLALKSVNCIPF